MQLGKEWRKSIKTREGKDRFPTIQEILSGIQLQEQINLLKVDNNKKNKKFLMSLTINVMYIWKHIFDQFFDLDNQEPLTYNILRDPSANIVCGLLYIFSMETFLYSTLNTATRENDNTKIFTLGPMARVLGTILDASEKEGPKDSKSLLLLTK